MSVETKAWCGECRSNQFVEQLMETEHRPAAGPEWVCTACGAAWLDLVTFDAAGPTRSRAVA